MAPRTVRVRGTRMWLVATRRSPDELRIAIAEYVRSGTTAAQREIIEYQLGLMGAAGSVEVQEIVTEALLDLGAETEIDRLLGRVFVERNGLVPEPRLLTEHEWGERMLQATLLRPEDARRRLPSAA